MSNYLARQRTELFRETYAEPVQPADQLWKDGKAELPAKSHFAEAQAAVISARAAKGYI
jgi:hypothetical protein